VARQLQHPERAGKVVNVSGGVENSISLAQLSKWCGSRFAPHKVENEPGLRRYDVAWLVLDSSRAEQDWSWKPAIGIESVLEEIAQHAEKHPEWLELSNDA
jgi:CDP-paratose 2-epimerase